MSKERVKEFEIISKNINNFANIDAFIQFGKNINTILDIFMVKYIKRVGNKFVLDTYINEMEKDWDKLHLPCRQWFYDEKGEIQGRPYKKYVTFPQTFEKYEYHMDGYIYVFIGTFHDKLPYGVCVRTKYSTHGFTKHINNVYGNFEGFKCRGLFLTKGKYFIQDELFSVVDYDDVDGTVLNVRKIGMETTFVMRYMSGKKYISSLFLTIDKNNIEFNNNYISVAYDSDHPYVSRILIYRSPIYYYFDKYKLEKISHTAKVPSNPDIYLNNSKLFIRNILMDITFKWK